MPPLQQDAKAPSKWALLAACAMVLAGLAWSSWPQAAALGLGALMQVNGVLGLLLASLAVAMAWQSRKPAPFAESTLALRLAVKLVAVVYLLAHLYAFSRLAALWTMGGVCLAVWGWCLGKSQTTSRPGGAM